MTARSLDLGATVAGVHLAFCAMNAPEAFSLPHDLRPLVTSRTGAIVLRKNFELSDYKREDFVYTKEMLLEKYPGESDEPYVGIYQKREQELLKR